MRYYSRDSNSRQDMSLGVEQHSTCSLDSLIHNKANKIALISRCLADLDAASSSMMSTVAGTERVESNAKTNVGDLYVIYFLLIYNVSAYLADLFMTIFDLQNVFHISPSPQRYSFVDFFSEIFFGCTYKNESNNLKHFFFTYLRFNVE